MTLLGKPKLNDFVILKVIGRGVMGKVMLVRHLGTRKLFALKSIHKEWILSHGQVQHAQSERAILAAFSESFYNIGDSQDDGFLIRLHASFQTSTEIFYVLDFMVGGDLASVISREGRLSEGRAKFVAAEIAIGLNLLHAKGIVYRDLKPENVLLDSRGHIVLTDFGLSKILPANPKTTNTFCGTAEYLAPEILKGDAYDQSVDWWSFGTMLYEMITGITPYWSDNANLMYRKILYEPKIEFPSFMSLEARDLISKVICRHLFIIFVNLLCLVVVEDSDQENHPGGNQNTSLLCHAVLARPPKTDAEKSHAGQPERRGYERF